MALEGVGKCSSGSTVPRRRTGRTYFPTTARLTENRAAKTRSLPSLVRKQPQYAHTSPSTVISWHSLLGMIPSYAIPDYRKRGIALANYSEHREEHLPGLLVDTWRM